VAHFGGSLFNSFVDKADEIFNDMPPPKPTKAKQQKNFVPVQSMRSYNRNSAPCFDGSCLIKMGDGTLIPVHSLKKGLVLDGGSKIVCVVKTVSKDGYQDLCQIEGGLLITPWHPIKNNGQWVFPQDLVQPKLRACPSVYSWTSSKLWLY
jgi:hypothetical protein